MVIVQNDMLVLYSNGSGNSFRDSRRNRNWTGNGSQSSAALYSLVWYSTVQYSTVQYSTV